MADRHEFRATTDHMLQLLDELRDVEAAKQQVALGSDEFVRLAGDAERLARLTFRWSQLQLSMAQVSALRVARGELAANIQLSKVDPRPLDVILANWRESQLRLEIASPGTPEATQAADDVERLREEYQAAFLARADTAAELAALPKMPGPPDQRKRRR